MSKKEVVTMLLAGGKGTRLGVLTKNIAKPAVPFGAEYRLIDFPLSNCMNSGLNTVGVLTQYEPLVLNSYIGNGSSWDLDSRDGGVTVLPPYLSDSGGRWYQGTADAVYQNIQYIDLYDPDYVLVLSGDHIYKMDYSLMIDHHKKKDSEATIAVREVSWDEATRFGVMISDEDGRINDFQEKPDEPRSNLASMGIYVFDWPLLRDYLEADAANPESDRDFGKNIIPSLLNDDRFLYTYEFSGYWKDVGTIKSYWNGHMDLLEERKKNLNLYDRDWIICSVNPNRPPQYISETAEISNAMINKGTKVEGRVDSSVLFYGTSVARGAVVKNSVLMPNVTVEEDAYINKAIVGQNSVIRDNARVGVGENRELDVTVIGEGETITHGQTIENGSTIG
ncbi:glucose-1-phosphate adenylyltransferase [Halarsenatibacter silvermanii]|uniref:Glucose-1-phosphate adenylyltransferase n=1 Tax=Halarsenatibacter silvermanii TaxID=321763 RepID=A0A1G9H2G8_9FIRM|nr:glucose-1-phosphate adenylyltransferase [Halarsenatibacter silvermanii]SDL07015.1 glucose-1-phosphate adenylyltransferase [Halarsenatibacter silvermanii]